MMEQTSTKRGEIEVIKITDSDFTSTFSVSPFGGQLIDWEKSGTPILFANQSNAITDGKTAYRGGAPIIFPYFGKGLLLPQKTPIDPQHGVARKTVWQREDSLQENQISFFTEQPSPATYPTTRFRLQITYTFTDDVAISSTITNIGDNACPIQFAVHSYWDTADLSKTSVQGLGNSYLDNLQNLSLIREPADLELGSETHFSSPFDRVYIEPAALISVATPRYNLTIQTKGCNSAVVWNPGDYPGHGLKDLQIPHFICVESGIVSPAVVIEPGRAISQHIQYTATMVPS